MRCRVNRGRKSRKYSYQRRFSCFVAFTLSSRALFDSVALYGLSAFCSIAPHNLARDNPRRLWTAPPNPRRYAPPPSKEGGMWAKGAWDSQNQYTIVKYISSQRKDSIEVIFQIKVCHTLLPRLNSAPASTVELTLGIYGLWLSNNILY